MVNSFYLIFILMRNKGDAILCQCGAVFNQLSELKAVEEGETSSTVQQFNVGDKVWTCEFCGAKRTVELEEEERPSAESLDFILAPPTEASEGSADDSQIIFCIGKDDVSSLHSNT